jgi:hypothetical protein
MPDKRLPVLSSDGLVLHHGGRAFPLPDIQACGRSRRYGLFPSLDIVMSSGARHSFVIKTFGTAARDRVEDAMEVVLVAMLERAFSYWVGVFRQQLADDGWFSHRGVRVAQNGDVESSGRISSLRHGRFSHEVAPGLAARPGAGCRTHSPL